MRTSPRPNAPSASWKSAASCIVSASSRSSVFPGTSSGCRRASSSSTRCTPSPNTDTPREHFGHVRGSRCSLPQWWQRTNCPGGRPSAPPLRWQIMPASQWSQRIIQPHFWSAHAM